MENHFDYSTNQGTKLSLQPFFSIVITTYNRAYIINRALDSLIRQTEEDWEAIIVDDGGQDDTYEKILPYLTAFSKIRYLQKAHTGEAASKNDGAYSSCGKFISFLDSDDEFKPRHLQSRKSILKQHPKVKFLYGGVKIIGNNYVPDMNNIERMIKLENCVIGGTFFVERCLFIALRGFSNIYLGTDADLYSRIRSRGVNMMESRVKTYVYHHEMADSITNRLYSEIKAAEAGEPLKAVKAVTTVNAVRKLT